VRATCIRRLALAAVLGLAAALGSPAAAAVLNQDGDDRLGTTRASEWQSGSTVYPETWTRRGNTSIFDVTDPRGGRYVHEVTLQGDRVTARRTEGDFAGRCRYEGTLAGDGRTVTGNLICDNTYPWRATITRAAAAPPPAAAPSAVNCGPHFTTYAVRSLGNIQGSGIRCASTTGNAAGAVGGVIWYGEGQWEGRPYRHLGYGNGDVGRPFAASAADINGNGEAFNSAYRGNLELRSSGDGSTIRVIGAWAEEWTRVESTTYAPLPRPRTCGSQLEEYRVSALAGSPGSGLRCLFDGALWFGNGEWGGTTYSHVGLVNLGSDGRGTGNAADLCGPAFGAYCGLTPPDSLNFARVSPRGYDVTGAWGEAWR
jgi:hypothetical protein